MIRYEISAVELVSLVQHEQAFWLANSLARTHSLIADGYYNEASSIWSEVKPIYMSLQHNKCIYCERLIGDQNYSRIENDLEHFRPKGKVTVWPKKDSEKIYKRLLGNPSDTGYYWLAYELKNYAVSCKTCNSTCKSTAFPIFGERGAASSTVSQLARSEKQVLCYPIGRSDVDPSTLIEFVGTTACPRGKRGQRKLRGKVIIDLFKLNKRDNLHAERAKNIALLGCYLDKIDRDENVDRYKLLVESSLKNDQSHAACSRDFVRTWFSDNDFARSIALEAEDLAARLSSVID